MILLFVTTLETISLLIKHNYYGLGKSLCYSSPIFITYIFLILSNEQYRSKHLRIINISFLTIIISFNIGFGVARIYKTFTHKDGILYPTPYVSAQDEGIDLKKYFDFNDLNFIATYTKGDTININIQDPWIEAYAEMVLLVHDIHFQTLNPISLQTGYPKTYPTPRNTLNAQGTLYLAKDDKRIFPYYIKNIRNGN